MQVFWKRPPIDPHDLQINMIDIDAADERATESTHSQDLEIAYQNSAITCAAVLARVNCCNRIHVLDLLVNTGVHAAVLWRCGAGGARLLDAPLADRREAFLSIAAAVVLARDSRIRLSMRPSKISASSAVLRMAIRSKEVI